MSVLYFADGVLTLSTDSVEATDTFSNGVLLSAAGLNRAIDSGGDEYSNGLLRTDSGQLRYVDATSGLPVGTTWRNGLPFSGGALCISTDAAVTYSNGMPFAANGAVAVVVNSAVMPDYYDIILLAGQSNMSGRGTIDAGIDTTDPNVYQFGCYDGFGTYRTIFAGSDPLTMPDTVAAANGVGPGMFFGKRYSLTRNRKVLLVPFARGGTSVVTGSTTWSPYGTNNADLLSAIDQSNRAITAAVAAFPGSSFKGICWLQGEGDGENSVTTAAYEAALADVIKAMRAGITGASSAWFVIGQMLPEAISSRGGYPAIDTAHTNLGNLFPLTTKVAIGTGYDSGDQLHYNAAGERLMGTTMANGISTAVANAGEASPGQVTGLATGTATNTSMPLTWSAASGTVRDYEIQYSPAGAGSWTTVSDGVSTATSGTATGLASSTSYDFRVRAINYNATAGAWSSTVTASTAAGLSDAFVRLTAIAGSLIAESGNAGVGWTYTCGSGAAYATDHAGTSDLKMPSGVDGSLRCIYPVDGLLSTRMLGLVTSQTNPAYSDGASGYKYGVLNHNSDTYRMIYEGGGSSQDPNGATLAPADGDVIRFIRSSGTVLCQVARTATPTTFTTIHTFAATYTGDLWAAVTFNTSVAGGSVATLIGNGWS